MGQKERSKGARANKATFRVPFAPPFSISDRSPLTAQDWSRSRLPFREKLMQWARNSPRIPRGIPLTQPRSQKYEESLVFSSGSSGINGRVGRTRAGPGQGGPEALHRR